MQEMRWTFVVPEDLPEIGLQRDDVITAAPGRPTRVLRAMPINSGLLLNLVLQDKLVMLDGVIGPSGPIVEAMQLADEVDDSVPVTGLRVIR